MAALKRLTHDVNVTNAFEAVICTATRQLNQMRNKITPNILRVHEMSHPKFSR
jgi:hypothetical protein